MYKFAAMDWTSGLNLLFLLFIIVRTKAAEATTTNNGKTYSNNLAVTTIQSKPFLNYKNGSLTGNDRFEGFIPDLLNELKKKVGFDYTISLVRDGRYGSNTANESWNGMIGEIISGNADMAAADLTITSLRKNIVDFTTPFTTSGIGILMKKEESIQIMDPYFFLKAFSLQVWLCAFIAFLGITILLFILARFSADEWANTDPPNERTNNLHVCNALYFVLASLLMQNSKVAPRGTAPRVLSCFWWLFCFFLMACYIANLTTMLVNRMDILPSTHTIKDVQDLSQQRKVKYGTLRAGSTFSFFKYSQLPIYQYMFNIMTEMEPPPFVSNYNEGVEKVLKGDFAFFMESSSIEYLVLRNCNLRQVGGVLDYRTYGLALRHGHPLIQPLSRAILALHEEGFLHKLRNKWWGTLNRDKCKETELNIEASLTLSSVRGVFHLLLIGIFVALLVAILEFIYRVKMKTGGGGSLCNEIVREIKFAFCGNRFDSNTNCKGNEGEMPIMESL